MSSEKRVSKYLLSLLIALIVLLIIIPFTFPFFTPYMGVGHMQGMAYMMGWGMLYFFIFLLTIGLIIALIVSQASSSGQIQKTIEPSGNNGDYKINELMRILTPEEKTIVNLLIKNKGEMLQKDISRALGFSRLKTHRILEKMEKRNIIQRIRIGNTNKVILEDWIMKYTLENA